MAHHASTISAEENVMNIKTVGVVGCGLMGSGIVEVCAKSGRAVVVLEMNDALLARGLQRIDASLAKAVERKKLDAGERDAIRGRVRGTTSFADFRDADFVVEAAIENLGEKKKIFAQLDAATRPDVILSPHTPS